MNIGLIIICVCLILLKFVKLECKFAYSAMRSKPRLCGNDSICGGVFGSLECG